MSYIYIMFKISIFSLGPSNKSTMVGIFQNYTDLQRRLVSIEEEYNIEVNAIHQNVHYSILRNIPDLSYNNLFHEKTYVTDLFDDYSNIKYVIYRVNKNDNMYDFNGIDCYEWYDFDVSYINNIDSNLDNIE